MSTVDEMAKLFDVAVGPNLDGTSDYGVTKEATEGVPASFDQQCEDVQGTLKEEVDESAVAKDTPTVNTSDIFDEIDNSGDTDNNDHSEDNHSEDNHSEDNPIDLQGEELEAYLDMKNRYPNFTLGNSSQSFKNFYKWKLKVLTDLLTRFSKLPLQDMIAEIKVIEDDHYLGEEVVTPELIRKKLDDTYRCRTRVTSLLMEAYEQFSSWKRMLELLQSKLYKDHDLKPVKKQGGLVLEHLHDVEMYVLDLKGFIEIAKTKDGLLQAAAESLSRQITCIQLKEPTGTEYEEVIGRVSAPLDDLDSIEDGTVIQKPTSMGTVADENFGGKISDDDPLASIG